MDIAAEFRAHERHLWGLCYRMTGVAADADELVQETFVRAMERPPQRRGESMRPWLVKVAANLSRDHLRRRKRLTYPGVWLPAPVEEDGWPAETAEGRYSLMESASMAFLVALEALTPAQRATLLLRDVLELSVAETADALESSAGSVKTNLHRARRRMAAYDASRVPVSAESQGPHLETLARFLGLLAAGDIAGMTAMFAEDAVALSDGGGVYRAAGRPILGPEKICRMYLGLARHDTGLKYAIRTVNGLPALVAEVTPDRADFAPRFVLGVRLDPSGRIAAVYSVLAPGKLTAIAAV